MSSEQKLSVVACLFQEYRLLPACLKNLVCCLLCSKNVVCCLLGEGIAIENDDGSKWAHALKIHRSTAVPSYSLRRKPPQWVVQFGNIVFVNYHYNHSHDWKIVIVISSIRITEVRYVEVYYNSITYYFFFLT